MVLLKSGLAKWLSCQALNQGIASEGIIASEGMIAIEGMTLSAAGHCFFEKERLHSLLSTCWSGFVRVIQ